MVSRGLQERLESSGFGRLAISVLIIAILLAVVVWNLPNSEIRRLLLPAVRPAVVASGLDQSWSVFAPDSRTQGLSLRARIRYADGTNEVWNLPLAREPVIDPYRAYHWQKWGETRHSSDPKGEFSAWLARRHHRGGRTPVEVTLLRRWYILTPPDGKRDVRRWMEQPIYVLRVTPAILRGQQDG